jgi:hypothetical protein
VRDWVALVREGLGNLDLSPAQQEETVAELAGHLEDVYIELRAKGHSESEAVDRALNEVSDWGKLAGEIRGARREEGNMNSRTRSFWLPGLVSLTGSMGLLMVLQRLNLQPYVSWYRAEVALTFYLPWLIAQPVFGAIGAYLSGRSGSSRSIRLAAGLFPAIAMLGLFCVTLLAGVFVERNAFIWHHLAYLALTTGVWVVTPGIGLLLGTLPFLKTPKALLSQPMVEN